jgi:hypothetical protein
MFLALGLSSIALQCPGKSDLKLRNYKFKLAKLRQLIIYVPIYIINPWNNTSITLCIEPPFSSTRNICFIPLYLTIAVLIASKSRYVR